MQDDDQRRHPAVLPSQVKQSAALAKRSARFATTKMVTTQIHTTRTSASTSWRGRSERLMASGQGQEPPHTPTALCLQATRQQRNPACAAFASKQATLRRNARSMLQPWHRHRHRHRQPRTPQSRIFFHCSEIKLVHIVPSNLPPLFHGQTL